ncbi:hypothetical protein Trydic_g2398 [Trypoxylus dichotomus]
MNNIFVTLFLLAAFPGFMLQDKNLTVTVLHTANFHASFEEVVYRGARTRYGDNEISSGIKDKRESNFIDYLRACNTTVLCANCERKSGQKLPNFAKSKVFEVEGYKFGITAYVGRHLVEPDISLFDVVHETAALEKVVEQFQRDGIKIIIVLSHSTPGYDAVVVKSVGHIDLIIGGHTHELYYNGKPPSDIAVSPYPKILKDKDNNDVLLVHPGAYGEYVGKITMTFDPRGKIVHYIGNPVHMNEVIDRDPKALQLLETFRPPVTKARETVVGQTRVKLDGACKWEECNLGNLITDAFVKYKASLYNHRKHWTDTPISLIEFFSIGGTTDVNLARNRTVTLADVYTMLPFRSRLRTITVTGTSLRKILEYSVSQGEASAGEFLQVSGLQLVYDMNRSKFNRLISAKVRCGSCDIPQYDDLQDTNKYAIILSEYLAEGNRGYTMIPKSIINNVEEEITDTQVLENYIRDNRIVQPEKQERIQLLNAKPRKRSGTTSIGTHPSYPVSVIILTAIKEYI